MNPESTFKKFSQDLVKLNCLICLSSHSVLPALRERRAKMSAEFKATISDTAFTMSLESVEGTFEKFCADLGALTKKTVKLSSKLVEGIEESEKQSLLVRLTEVAKESQELISAFENTLEE